MGLPTRLPICPLQLRPSPSRPRLKRLQRRPPKPHRPRPRNPTRRRNPRSGGSPKTLQCRRSRDGGGAARNQARLFWTKRPPRVRPQLPRPPAKWSLPPPSFPQAQPAKKKSLARFAVRRQPGVGRTIADDPAGPQHRSRLAAPAARQGGNRKHHALRLSSRTARRSA